MLFRLGRIGRLGLPRSGGTYTPPSASAPSNLTAPVISGSGVVGTPLSCTTGNWSGYPAPAITYQWRADGVDISGETASTYTPVSGDVGAAIDCNVTATNASGSASADSNDITVTDAPVEPTAGAWASGAWASGAWATGAWA